MGTGDCERVGLLRRLIFVSDWGNVVLSGEVGEYGECGGEGCGMCGSVV